MSKTLSLTFLRGARRVTGSQFLLEAKENEKTVRILIDCGLAQGERFCESVNKDAFSYDPHSLDAVFFTHAHADHIGLFPKLVKEGFAGDAYATKPTVNLMPVMLEDSVSIIGKEAAACGYEAPYTMSDVEKAVRLIQETSYHSPVSVGPYTVTFFNAGHIVGSATILVEVFGKKLLFTGDLGRVPAAIVPDREAPPHVDYLITESVYGNRLHGPLASAEAELLRTVNEAYKNKGVLLIPAFSLERTQILLSILDRAMDKGDIPKIPVFMDSPLAAKVTDIYRSHPEFLRDDVRSRLEGGDDPFSFPTLSLTVAREESDAIERVLPPKIVIAGAGMSHGGRIRKHEKRYLPEKSSTLLLVGYQVPGSLGRRLKDGAKKVEIDGEWIPVKAKVRSIGGFSAHADRDDLMNFAEATQPKKVFVVLGETASAAFLAQRMAGFFNVETAVPKEGEQVWL
jgi:metallo-beta-lactamase family protein